LIGIATVRHFPLSYRTLAAFDSRQSGARDQS
jgi:hypothetical protein